MIVCTQHVPFETPGIIEAWSASKNFDMAIVHLYEDYYLPDVSSIDMLVVMGGPMGVNDEQKYPWLKSEKHYIEQAIKHNKKIIGICLGAQIIAHVMGARVYKNTQKEIGWFTIKKVVDENIIAKVLPEQCMAFHWHGDTFDIPRGAVHIASSAACVNQGYAIGDSIVGLQFHLEITPEGVNNLLEHCSNELDSGTYVQSKDEILSGIKHCDTINMIASSLLEAVTVSYRT
jgi:GMP synthase-like glutamine amidotransferase